MEKFIDEKDQYSLTNWTARTAKSKFKKKSQLSIEAVPKKKQNKQRKKNNGFRPQPFSFEEGLRKLLAGKVSLLVLLYSPPVHSDPLHRAVLLPDISFFTFF